MYPIRDRVQEKSYLRRWVHWGTSEPMPEEKIRRKSADERKEAYLRVRVSESHMDEFKEAAKKAGISVSAWVVERLLRIARSENKKT